MAEEQPKIIVDSDWKTSAQAEREKLAEQADAAQQKPGGRGSGDMPPADFRTLVGSLGTQALMYMGGVADPETGRAIVALDYARHYIDLLGVLEEKTKGNLDEEEAKDIGEVLSELRNRFVQLTGLVEDAQREQAKGGGGQGPAGPVTGQE